MLGNLGVVGSSRGGFNDSWFGDFLERFFSENEGGQIRLNNPLVNFSTFSLIFDGDDNTPIFILTCSGPQDFGIIGKQVQGNEVVVAQHKVICVRIGQIVDLDICILEVGSWRRRGW